MRDHLRTPQQLHKHANRKLKWSAEQSRSPKKIVKQCLDSVIAPGSDDVSINLAKDSADESVEISINSSSPAASPSIESAAFDLSPLSSTLTSDASPISSDLSTLSSTVTSDKVQTDVVKVNCRTANFSDNVKGDSWKAELFAKKITHAGTQRLDSNNMILLSKSVLEELLKIVIEELHNLPEKRDWFTEIVEKKVMNVLKKVFCVISAFMMLITFVGVFIFSSDYGSSYNEFVPT